MKTALTAWEHTTHERKREMKTVKKKTNNEDITKKSI